MTLPPAPPELPPETVHGFPVWWAVALVLGVLAMTAFVYSGIKRNGDDSD